MVSVSSGFDFFNLPKELTGFVVSKWLDLRCLAAVDNACCNHSTRAAILDALASPLLLVVDNMEEFERKYDSIDCFLDWISKRNVRMRQLSLANCIESSVVEYLHRWGHFVTHLKAKRTDFAASLESSQYFAEGLTCCPNLTELDLGGSSVNKIVIEAISKCTSLRVFRRREYGPQSDCTGVDLNTIYESLHLTTLELRRDESFRAFLKMVHPASLKLLHVVWSREHPVDTLIDKLRQCCNLDSLLVHGDGQFGDAQFLALLAVCPPITYLHWQGRCLTSMCAPVIAQTLTKLRCIHISNCQWANEMLMQLAEHRADSLEELDLDLHYPVCGNGLNNVLTKCHRLRSLRIERIEKIAFNMALLCNLSTFVFTAQESASAVLAQVSLHGSNLTRLGVVADLITERDLTALSELSLPSLRQIDLFSVNIVKGRLLKPGQGYLKATVDLTALRARQPNVLVRWNHNMFTATAHLPCTSIEDLFSVSVVS